MRGKKLLSLVLTLALALSFVPAAFAAPKEFSEIVINMDDSGLVVGSYPDDPNITWSPEEILMNWGSCYWERKKDEGGWEMYIGHSKLIVSGTYRYSFSMFFDKHDFTPASDEITVIVNGVKQTVELRKPSTDGNYYFDFVSPERKAGTLPAISGTAKIEPADPATLKVGMDIDCVVTGGPDADKLHYQWLGKESAGADASYYYIGSANDKTKHLYPSQGGHYIACQVSAEGYSGYLYTPWRYISEEEYVPTPHAVTVEGGAAGVSEALKGDTVTVKADGKIYHKFSRWEVISGNAALKDPYSAETSFIMPDHDVKLRAVYEFAPEYLTDFYVYMTPPTAGEKPQAPTVKSDEYDVKAYHWVGVKDNVSFRMAEGDVFEAGVFYQCRADLALKEKQVPNDGPELHGFVNDDPSPDGMDVIVSRLSFAKVKVIGSFNCASASSQPEKKENPFADISASDPFYGAVLWAYYHDPQITNGIDATHFGPMSTVTRGQAVTFLWRAWGCPEPTNPAAAAKFTDLTQDYYKKAVAWAVERGIAKGVDDTHYAPDNTLKTAHIVTFLYRAENPGKDGWYAEAADWADYHEVTTGVQIEIDDKTDCPRAAVVMLLANWLARE